MPALHNKHIVLGITGSIAAYKSADLVRRLRDAGAEVRVVLTESAQAFITPLTLQAVSDYPVHEHFLDAGAEAAMSHIELARWADLILIAPASADCIAQLAHGHANNLLTTLCLASQAIIAIAPAMNQHMWQHAATQANVTVLRERNVKQIGPAVGEQACGDYGPGRMLDPELIVAEVTPLLSKTNSLAEQHVLITAGPTQEAIDPVRFISNHSSGKMGYALAAACVQAGATVTLISGPTHLPCPQGITRIDVVSAVDMERAVCNHIHQCTVFIGCAAVSDYRCAAIKQQKIKKTSSDWQLSLTPNPDILAKVADLSPRPYVVGFAAETDHMLTHAKQKLTAKNLDMIVANQVGATENGFNSDSNAVTILMRATLEELVIPSTKKTIIAQRLIQLIAKQLCKKSN